MNITDAAFVLNNPAAIDSDLKITEAARVWLAAGGKDRADASGALADRINRVAARTPRRTSADIVCRRLNLAAANRVPFI